MSRRRQLALWSLFLVWAGFGSIGCGAGEDQAVFLGVQLVTDLVPGEEFTHVEVRVDNGAKRFEPALQHDYFEPHRVADFRALAPSARRRLTVRLLDNDGRAVLERGVEFEHRRALTRTLTLTRDCRGLRCEAGKSCLAGACVDARCLSGDEEPCGKRRCTEDSDCGSPCELCRLGVCLIRTGATVCTDGGVPDGGGPDGGKPDASVDAGAPPTLCNGAPCPIEARCSGSNFERHRYWLCSTAMIWSDSWMFCRANAAHIAFIGSSGEGEHIAQRIDQVTPDGDEGLHFMGLSDHNNHGTYVWLGGAPVEYDNWAANEPNSRMTADCSAENCGAINAHGLWRDVCCQVKRPFVCERDSAP